MIADLIWRICGLEQITERICDEKFKERYDEIKAHILASLKPGDVLPGGLMVVPIDPTPEMGIAAYDAWDAFGDNPILGPVETIAIYRAMLAAAKEG